MTLKLSIKDKFSKELPADPHTKNSRRTVKEACFSYVLPKPTAAPQLLHYSPEMLQEIGLTEADATSNSFMQLCTGNHILPNTKPYAMCYGGHQFGNWAGQLGDGRAINLAEVEHNHKNWALQLKGAGETPYSRNADGLAVLRSSVREYLCSEAMHHLGIPTTRAVSLSLSGDQVLRDMLYNGNPAYEKGAIVCRAAASFIRFGNFEIFAARNDIKTLKTLVDYTLKQHYPHLGAPSKQTYIAFLQEVGERSLAMVMHWQRVGFVHGVMNTDNMSILGLTIDYGPYGWLEGYDPGWTPNTTDSQYKRYRYGTQPHIVLWNLFKLVNALFPLIEDVEALENMLENFQHTMENQLLEMMKTKLGLFQTNEFDAQLIQDLQTVLQATETDMTLFFRNLAHFKKEGTLDGIKLCKDAFYKPDELKGTMEQDWKIWFSKYQQRLQTEPLSDEKRKIAMNTTNPKYVLRNYMAQMAIDDADKGNYALIDELFNLLKKPYDEQPENEKWFAKRPEWARNKIGCSMLSCSS